MWWWSALISFQCSTYPCRHASLQNRCRRTHLASFLIREALVLVIAQSPEVRPSANRSSFVASIMASAIFRPTRMLFSMCLLPMVLTQHQSVYCSASGGIPRRRALQCGQSTWRPSFRQVGARSVDASVVVLEGGSAWHARELRELCLDKGKLSRHHGSVKQPIRITQRVIR